MTSPLQLTPEQRRLLATPLRLGALTLPNRIIMPPLTRMRAGPGQVPTASNAAYYAQRASAGLIITEATHISAQGRGLPDVPGIYTPQQMLGWGGVAKAVHRAGGRIFMQLFHTGRLSHSAYQAGNAAPVGASALAAPGQGFLPDFSMADFQTPRPLGYDEIAGVVADFRQAALNAVAAGFDGVELHAANGYLLEQFLVDGSNRRDDAYGGLASQRSRLLREVVSAVAGAIGTERLGLRLSPFGKAGGSVDSDPASLFRHVVDELDKHPLAYLHLIEARASGMGRADVQDAQAPNVLALLRQHFSGAVISSGGYLPDSGAAALQAGQADAIGFGRLFIANPDLVARILAGAPLNPYDRPTFYGGSAHGYTDYPALA